MPKEPYRSANRDALWGIVGVVLIILMAVNMSASCDHRDPEPTPTPTACEPLCSQHPYRPGVTK